MGGSASSPLLVLFQQTINEALSGIRKKDQTRLTLTLSPFLVVHPHRETGILGQNQNGHPWRWSGLNSLTLGVPGCVTCTCVCLRGEEHWISSVSQESRTPKMVKNTGVAVDIP